MKNQMKLKLLKRIIKNKSINKNINNNFDLLANETIIQIFSYLNLQTHLLSISLVCINWRNCISFKYDYYKWLSFINKNNIRGCIREDILCYNRLEGFLLLFNAIKHLKLDHFDIEVNIAISYIIGLLDGNNLNRFSEQLLELKYVRDVINFESLRKIEKFTFDIYYSNYNCKFFMGTITSKIRSLIKFNAYEIFDLYYEDNIKKKEILRISEMLFGLSTFFGGIDLFSPVIFYLELIKRSAVLIGSQLIKK